MVTTGDGGGARHRHPVGESQGYCETSYNARPFAPTKNYLAPNVNRAEGEIPFSLAKGLSGDKGGAEGQHRPQMTNEV